LQFLRQSCFGTVEGRGRVHFIELFKKMVHLDIVKYSFGNRVCDQWNNFPAAIVSSREINTFTGRLNRNIPEENGGFK